MGQFGSKGGLKRIVPVKGSGLQMIGFGSRGGFRDTGVVRKDEPMEKPTATTPMWAPPQPSNQQPTQNEPRS